MLWRWMTMYSLVQWASNVMTPASISNTWKKHGSRLLWPTVLAAKKVLTAPIFQNLRNFETERECQKSTEWNRQIFKRSINLTFLVSFLYGGWKKLERSILSWLLVPTWRYVSGTALVSRRLASCRLFQSCQARSGLPTQAGLAPLSGLSPWLGDDIGRT